MASLSKIAELSYERDGDGNVVMQNGKPVIGEDFFGFVDNVVALDLEHRAQDVTTRLKANNYRSEEERTRDQRVNDALACPQGRIRGHFPRVRGTARCTAA